MRIRQKKGGRKIRIKPHPLWNVISEIKVNGMVPAAIYKPNRIIELPEHTNMSHMKIEGYYWTYNTLDMQNAFFRDWGQFWNHCDTEISQAQSILDSMPGH